eukprot:gene9694-1900_t
MEETSVPKRKSVSVSNKPFHINEHYFDAVSYLVCKNSNLDTAKVKQTIKKLINVPEVKKIIQESSEAFEKESKIEVLNDIKEEAEDFEANEFQQNEKVFKVQDVFDVIQEEVEHFEANEVQQNEKDKPKEIESFFSKFSSTIMKFARKICDQIFSKRTTFVIAVITGVVILGMMFLFI